MEESSKNKITWLFGEHNNFIDLHEVGDYIKNVDKKWNNKKYKLIICLSNLNLKCKNFLFDQLDTRFYVYSTELIFRCSFAMHLRSSNSVVSTWYTCCFSHLRFLWDASCYHNNHVNVYDFSMLRNIQLHPFSFGFHQIFAKWLLTFFGQLTLSDNLLWSNWSREFRVEVISGSYYSK